MTIGKVLLALLVICVAFAVLGFVIKALFWLGVIGFIFFLMTLVSSVGRRVFVRR